MKVGDGIGGGFGVDEEEEVDREGEEEGESEAEEEADAGAGGAGRRRVVLARVVAGEIAPPWWRLEVGGAWIGEHHVGRRPRRPWIVCRWVHLAIIADERERDREGG